MILETLLGVSIAIIIIQKYNTIQLKMKIEHLNKLIEMYRKREEIALQENRS